MSEDLEEAPDWAEHAKGVVAQLDQIDYFGLLGVENDATLDEVRAGYRSLQQIYHPDRVFRGSDAELVSAVERISKRLTEAYVVLRDPKKREQYAKDITGPNREQKLRFGADSEQQAASDRRLQVMPNSPKARTLFINAKKAIERGDFAAAARDLRMADMFEPNNPAILDLIERTGKAQ